MLPFLVFQLYVETVLFIIFQASQATGHLYHNTMHTGDVNDLIALPPAVIHLLIYLYCISYIVDLPNCVLLSTLLWTEH